MVVKTQPSYKICLGYFPFAENPGQTKYRPVLCLSSPQGRFGLVVSAAISAQITDNPDKSDVIISHKCLNKQSVIRLSRLSSLPTGILKEELGILSPSDSQKVRNQLIKLLRI